MPSPSPDPSTLKWWSTVSVPNGEARRWRIGPLTLWAHRRRYEWRITSHRADDPMDEAFEVATPVVPEAVPEDEAGMNTVRYTFGAAPSRLTLTPRLADRPMVVHPAHPMTLPAGESAVLYVSSPLWAAVATEEPAHALSELPCYRPSDTWFGPSTTVGELCYASRTSGRLELDALPLRPHRAVTPVRIRNQARDALPLARLKVPVELLPLFDTRRGPWTPPVTLVRTDADGGDFAELHIGTEPPREAGRARTVAPARTRAEGALGLRAFSRLLGLGGST